MRSFSDILLEVKKEVELIKDEKTRDKALEYFKRIPTNPNLFKVGSYSGILIDEDSLTAGATGRQICEAYVKSKARDAVRHYTTRNWIMDDEFKSKAMQKETTKNKHIPDDKETGMAIIPDDREIGVAVIPDEKESGFSVKLTDLSDKNGIKLKYSIVNPKGVEIESEVVDEKWVEFDLLFTYQNSEDIEKKNVDQFNLWWAKKSEKISLRKGGFGVQTIVTDQSATNYYVGKKLKKAKRIQTPGVVQKQEIFDFNCPRNTKDKFLAETTETLHEIGRNSNLEEYSSLEKVTTSIVDGRVAEIETKKTLKTGDALSKQKVEETSFIEKMDDQKSAIERTGNSAEKVENITKIEKLLETEEGRRVIAMDKKNLAKKSNANISNGKQESQANESAAVAE